MSNRLEDVIDEATVRDGAGAIVTRSRVAATFKLTAESARDWIEEGGAAEE